MIAQGESPGYSFSITSYRPATRFVIACSPLKYADQRVSSSLYELILKWRRIEVS